MRKQVILSYLSWAEMHYIKQLLGAKSIDEVVKLLYRDMRKCAMKLHHDIVANEADFLSRQFGGYKPAFDETGMQPATED